MTAYSIWPSAVCTAVILGFAGTPVFARADVPPQPGNRKRNTGIDGLRGLLALAVYFHHAEITHQYLQTGVWASVSLFYDLMGRVAVFLFFMITAYLFWGKVLDKYGRSNWLHLYLGRVFRLAPLYWFAVAWLFIVVASRSHFQLHESKRRVASEVAKWVSLGLVSPLDINAYSGTNMVIAGVTWTLQFEWFFYFSLIPLSLLAINGRYQLSLVLLALVSACTLLPFTSSQWEQDPVVLCVTFLFGMATASLEHAGKLATISEPFSGICILLLLGAGYIGYVHGFIGPAVIASGLTFYLIVSGCTLFRLLTTAGARRLGESSYGIYLLQGLVLTMSFALPRVKSLALSSVWLHWLIVLSVGLLLVLIAAVTHILIERPGIAWGRRLMS